MSSFFFDKKYEQFRIEQFYAVPQFFPKRDKQLKGA